MKTLKLHKQRVTSSGDEIANMNFLYDDTVHALENTTDYCINSATDRFLQRRFTKFSEIKQYYGHYAVEGHSRSPILVPIKSSYTTINIAPILHRFQVIWLIIDQIFASESGVPHFNALAGGDPLPISP